ncbi:putative galactose mutarotase [Nostocoides japonicum T1-X7]|uniref:Putative galactose mutarotase n=1 Tax=Nostocoides japonicum T1-X7 TaxID=1194083 RepID=A0A077LYS9_9MICO|nr:aldose 1-epimerase family protein [Tetrasphaera japonica]CCH77124.1 putative galactose mutarotase [Tetrasphaera japonica T1-X7]
MTRPASGEQWILRRGEDEVTVVEVGGGLRRWVHEGVDVLAGYGADEMCRAGRGQLLMPWPNRIRDGRYDLDGTSRQLPLTEPAFGNASHGLVRWLAWTPAEHSDDTLTVTCALHPQPGWEWSLDLSVTYRLGDGGLSVSTAVRNVGEGRAPFGYGAHPYVSIGSDDPAGVVLQVPAERWVEVDDRLLPVAVRDVEGTELDFRAPRPLGSTSLDTAMTGLCRDDDGCWRITVSGLSALPPVTIWADASFGWTQVFTGKAAAEGEHGVAVEPMSCPADAFNSGIDLVRLGPGEEWSGTWGISLG